MEDGGWQESSPVDYSPFGFFAPDLSPVAGEPVDWDVGEERSMNERKPRNGRLGTLIGLVGIAFAVTLAVIVGNRLSDEAMAVLAGAVCGVGAAIPTSLLVFAVSRQRNEDNKRRVQPSASQSVYPPVVVVAPPTTMASRPTSLPAQLPTPVQRIFTITEKAPVDVEVIP